MPVGGDDDTLASSVPTIDGGSTTVSEAELVVGRYRIIRWLGGGGMGRVYEALDTELDERVALKVLKAGLSDDALERFRREVKLTRRIQHKNVARMFDIGEHKGEKFLTMELVEGEPLTKQIGEPLPWQRLAAVGEQICDGLAAAHAAGVVHRDLKPDNVLIEAGTERVVITDFGIARGADDPGVTQVGAIVGTPRYMAPEQLAGREVDARADLFSLGVMLFELATGMRPWPGDNAIAIAVSQATTAPRTIDTSAGAMPAWFGALVASCLQLDPDDRPAAASDVATSFATGTVPPSKRDSGKVLAKVTAAAAPQRPHAAREAAQATLQEPTSVAVLPIACTPGDEYLADGIVEDMTDTLSTTAGIRVRPTGVVRSTTAPDPRELGERLHVDHVVTGTLRRTPAGLRIATRLIGVADGFQIWANKTDCTDAEVLSVADDLARGIAAALSTRATAVTKPTDPRAVDLYLRARAELRRFWGSHAETAAGLLEQAVGYAPTSPPILGAYAYAAVQAWVMRGEPQLLPRAELALERALATGHGEAYLASAQHRFNRAEPERGAADLARALVRTPMSAQSHELAGKILLEIEGPAPARHHYETARGLDPGRSQVIDNDMARLDALEGNWAEADRRINALLTDSDPSIQQLGFVNKARQTMWRGPIERIREISRVFMTRVNPSAVAAFRFVDQLDRSGELDREAWRRTLNEPFDPRVPRRQLLIRTQVYVEIALAFDQADLAIEAIERLNELGFMDITWLDKCPLMEKIVEHKRFARVRREVSERASRVLAAFRSVATQS
jgi:TolB-like protein/predicted Ser/Thr protein kinase